MPVNVTYPRLVAREMGASGSDLDQLTTYLLTTRNLRNEKPCTIKKKPKETCRESIKNLL